MTWVRNASSHGTSVPAVYVRYVSAWRRVARGPNDGAVLVEPGCRPYSEYFDGNIFMVRGYVLLSIREIQEYTLENPVLRLGQVHA